jgi:hypothetical protein
MKILRRRRKVANLDVLFGGELKSLDGTEFKDTSLIDVVGIFPNYATAYSAWKAKAQMTEITSSKWEAEWHQLFAGQNTQLEEAFTEAA